MPISLCSIKYAGDVISSSTFKYDTSSNIIKSQNKLLESTVSQIDKSNDNEYLYKINGEVNRQKGKLLVSQCQQINKNNHDNKIVHIDIRGINKINDYQLKEDDVIINKDNVFNLANTQYRDMDKKNNVSLAKNYPLDINVSWDKSLGIINIREVNKDLFKSLSSTHIYMLGEIPRTIGLRGPLLHEVSTNINKGLITAFPRDMGKSLSKNVNIDCPISLFKYVNPESISLVDDLVLNKNIITKLMYRFNTRSIYKYNINKFIYRENTKLIDKSYLAKIITRINDRFMFIDNSNKLLYRIAKEDISKYISPNYMHRIALKYVYKYGGPRYYYRKVLRGVIKNSNEHYLDRAILVDTYKTYGNYLDRLNITYVYNSDYLLLNDLSLINVYRQLDYYAHPLNDIPIFTYKSKEIGNDNYIPIYADKSHYIDIVKRWWWLGSHSPTDPMIIPNKDYGNMIELLSNDHFEYLRYNNHPIEWGSNWGKDFNIPPRAVSIAIMLDVVNIIIMIWHKSTQGWLNVTGREGIQFLMELIYDWYIMNSSNPNADYYRIYRWVRWEAEKVYFLNLDNGLQSIGRLAENLLDYIKYHHFNLVPIWRNPKAMDKERNFNKIATSNDLIKELDKLKGRRYYQIETKLK